jgi:hypothetical protein
MMMLLVHLLLGSHRPSPPARLLLPRDDHLDRPPTAPHRPLRRRAGPSTCRRILVIADLDVAVCSEQALGNRPASPPRRCSGSQGWRRRWAGLFGRGGSLVGRDGAERRHGNGRSAVAPNSNGWCGEREAGGALPRGRSLARWGAVSRSRVLTVSNERSCSLSLPHSEPG